MHSPLVGEKPPVKYLLEEALESLILRIAESGNTDDFDGQRIEALVGRGYLYGQGRNAK